MTDSRTDYAGTDQERLWDADAAARYDTPDEGMFAPDTLDPAVDRLAALAGRGSAVELAVGTGRVAIPLAARGVPVTGIEISRHMVARLREKADERTLPVVVGDRGAAGGPGEHGGGARVARRGGGRGAPGGGVECFRNAARHLVPGGRFVVELWVPELRALPPGRTATVWLAEPGHLGVDTYDVLHQRVVSHHVRFDDDGHATVGRTPHRYVWPPELDLMARLAGLELETRHAGWAGEPFTAESPSHVSVYRRPPRPAPAT